MRRPEKKQTLRLCLAGLAVGLLALLGSVRPVVGQIIEVGPLPETSVVPGEVFGDSIVVDMSGAAGLNIASLQFDVTWDPTHLEYISFDQSDLPPGWTGIPNETDVGLGWFRWAGFSPTGRTGSFIAVTLVFGGIAPDETQTSICVDVLVAGDEAGGDLMQFIPTPQCGSICVGVSGIWGDVNGDGVVNIIDAQQVARYSVGLPPPPDPFLVGEFGDVNHDGVVNIIDAQQIARYSVGLGVCGTCNPGEPKAGCPELPDVAILHWTDVILGTSAVPGALDRLGMTATDAADAADFVSLLQGGGWDVVIFGEHNTAGGIFQGAVRTELEAYVAGGGKLLAATWRLELSGFLEATVFGTNPTHLVTDGHPIFAGLPASIVLANPGWGVFAQAYQPTGAAQCIGSTSIGDCAAI
ncbi:MAG: hypothetical protein JSW71_07990, partial [Gemmatimonadota bacterium]